MFDQRYYTYIKAIADFKGFSKAAEHCYISQSFLSHFVKKIEEELGVELFDRRTIPISLTAAGVKYLEYLERFHELDITMRADFAALSNKDSYTSLSIASLRLLGNYILPKVIPEFLNRHPSVDLRIVDGSSQDMMQRLNSQNADLLITNMLPEMNNYHYQKICDDPIMLAAPYNKKMEELFPGQNSSPQNPLKADLSLLRNETLILLKSGLNMRTASDAVCNHYDFHPRHIIEVSGLGPALSLLGAERGITFVNYSSVSNLQPETPIIYFSAGEMENVISIFAVFHKNNRNPLIDDFCLCASKQLACSERKGL